jgi:hypothetical protein
VIRPDNLISIAYLASLIAFACEYLSRTLFRTWFFSSDEWVFAAEVIRFSNLDFRQHFFDIPGTPFMMLDAAIWSAIYAGARAVGFVPPGTGPGPFAFQHLPALFILMRGTTLVFFLLSAVLLFFLGAALINRAAGALASLLLVMSPTYASYSSFVRTESLALSLMLGAMLWLTRGGVKGSEDDLSRAPAIKDRATGAGILAGLAAGARLHSMTAVLPVLVLTLWLNRPFRKPAYPAWVPRWLKYLLPAGWAASAFLFFGMRAYFRHLPAAVRFVDGTVVAGVIFSVSATTLYLVSRTRPLVVRVASPEVIKLFLGYGAGFLLGIPTIWTQYNFFFRSIQMYSGYMDFERLKWSFWKNLTWYVGQYVEIVAPDRVTLGLLCLGTVSILIVRDRKMLPVLAAAVLFFFSKPLSLVAAPHHMILWLPFFYLVCAYPVGQAFNFISRSVPRAVSMAALALCLIVCFRYLTPGPKKAAANSLITEDRLHNIERATGWIEKNTAPNATVAISYFCFNPDAFYLWLSGMDVRVPPSALDGRQYIIWWGNASALKGKAGYACATKSDVVAMKTQLDLARPGEGTDPYNDPRLQMVASFGSGSSEVDLFHFDYKQFARVP